MASKEQVSRVFLSQFYGPVCIVEELFPAMVSLVVQVDMYDGVAFWFYRFCDQGHSGLFWCSAAFFYVAFSACTDNIFPCCRSSESSWDDVVEGEF